MVDEKYKTICEKLGFIPSELSDDVPAEENDTFGNPFAILTSEESLYLYENGYLISNAERDGELKKALQI